MKDDDIFSFSELDSLLKLLKKELDDLKNKQKYNTCKYPQSNKYKYNLNI